MSFSGLAKRSISPSSAAIVKASTQPIPGALIATAERIRFLPSFPIPIRWTNRPTFQQFEKRGGDLVQGRMLTRARFVRLYGRHGFPSTGR